MSSETMDIERLGQIFDKYQRMKRGQQTEHTLIFEDPGRYLTYEDVKNHSVFFERLIPFIQINFDEDYPLFLTDVLRGLDRDKAQLILDLLPVFEGNPELLKIYLKEALVSSRDIEGHKNHVDFRRIMYDEGLEQKCLAEKLQGIIEENQKLYLQLEKKYAVTSDAQDTDNKAVDGRELVVCTLFEDSLPSEICIVFINRGLKTFKTDLKAAEIQKKAMDNSIGCRVLIRPKAGGIDYLGRWFGVAKSGLVEDEDHRGVLFLAPPYSPIDEQDLLELLASDKSPQEIKQLLETGASGVKEYVEKQP